MIAGQDVECDDPDDPDEPGAAPRWRIAQQVAPDRVISVVDLEARHAHKTVHRRQDGCEVHVAVEPDTGLVTAAAPVDGRTVSRLARPAATATSAAEASPTTTCGSTTASPANLRRLLNLGLRQQHGTWALA